MILGIPDVFLMALMATLSPSVTVGVIGLYAVQLPLSTCMEGVGKYSHKR